MTTWFIEGVGQMTMFDHDGGRGGQNFQKSDHVVYGCPLRQIATVSFLKYSQPMRLLKDLWAVRVTVSNFKNKNE